MAVPRARTLDEAAISPILSGGTVTETGNYPWEVWMGQKSKQKKSKKQKPQVEVVGKRKGKK